MKRVLAIGVLSLMSAVAVAQTTNGGDIGSSSQSAPAQVDRQVDAGPEIINAKISHSSYATTDSVVFSDLYVTYQDQVGGQSHTSKVIVPSIISDQFARSFCRAATGGNPVEIVEGDRYLTRDKLMRFTALDSNLNIFFTNISEISRKFPNSVEFRDIAVLETIVCTAARVNPPARAQVQ